MREFILFFIAMLLFAVPFYCVFRGGVFTRCVVYSWLANGMFCTICATCLPPLMRSFSPSRVDHTFVDPLGVVGLLVVGWIFPCMSGVIAIVARELLVLYRKREAYAATKPVEPTG